VRDPLALAAVRSVPRHEFVPVGLLGSAYRDAPLPIGNDQTISQPYIVALMTEALGLEGGERVLEVGTGSGYQAAVLAEIVGHVDTLEIHDTLAAEAAERLNHLGYHDVTAACPKPRRSTRSSSRPRPTTCRGPCSSSSRSGGSSCSRSGGARRCSSSGRAPSATSRPRT